MKFVFPIPHLMQLKALSQPWEAKVTGADQTRIAQRLDELGYDQIAVPEHFLIPKEHVELSGAHYFDATAAQGFLLGATRRIRLNSAITLLPLHHPVRLAKAIATLDWMSEGRMDVTFGVGWLKAEFDMMGVPFHERGRIADEYLEAMIELWTKDDPSYEGRYVRFKDICFEPKPVQRPHPTIWIGGDSDAALRRAARFASGWHVSYRTKPEDIPARLDYLRAQPGFRGEPFEVMYSVSATRIGLNHAVVDDPRGHGGGMSAQAVLDSIGWLQGLGVTVTSVPVPELGGVEAFLDFAQWVAEEIVPKAR